MKILLAIDGSAHSAAALEEVVSRQWPSGTEVEILTVVHATTPLLLDPAFVMAAAYVDTTHELRRLAPALLDAAAARLRRDHPALAITTKVLEGTPRELIVQEAADWDADLIVLGSHGHGPLRQALLGSVATGVAADAACAVEIIRAGRQAVSVRR
jgi:nucleotide-binding universal stress UspA family protein